MDEEVHGFCTDALPPLNTRVRSSMPFIPNGSDAKAFQGSAFSERKHHKRPDIAERGMDEEVHGFCTDALPPLNTRVRSSMPFIPNGSDAKAFEGSAFMGAEDVAERNMDGKVYGFVSGQDEVTPLHAWENGVRSKEGYAPNGSASNAFKGSAFSERKHHHKHHKRPDIAERGMDEEVHGFCTDALPPLNTRVRSNMPFIPNGSDAKAFEGSAFSERKHHHKHHKRPDIAERGMDEEVHGFCTDALPPLNTRVRSNMPFIPNGSDAKAFEGSAFMGRRPDVAERGMDEDVWGFVTEAIPPLNTRERAEMPWAPNGVSNQWAQTAQSFAQKSPDIAERNMELGWVHPFSAE